MNSTGHHRSRKYIGLRHENVDSKIRFTIEPLPGDDAFDQWKDGMKAVAGLPMGIPADFRKKVWLSLADNYLRGLCIDWEKTKNLAFNRKSNPDDNKLGLQIVKDLHRTGSSAFSGHDNDEDRAMLERVLLAYARWNKQVGYCQGFNVIAAMILDVMDRQEDCALKVMIFLIDRVLPEGYFANNLRSLSVDMAVFRELLRSHLPRFSRHLDWLQAAALDQTTGASYEPPLTNVFTMQWFLTLFATCLPKSTALRVWDAVLLEGSEILLRSAIAVWGTLQRRLSTVHTADEFYTTMGVLTQEMLDGKIIDEDELIEKVYEMGTFPMPGLNELREKYRYVISPFAPTSGAIGRPKLEMLSHGHDDGNSYDEMMDITCFAGMFPPSPHRESGSANPCSESNTNQMNTSPSKLQSLPVLGTPLERMARDVDLLDRQYKRLKERQKQAHIILTGARQQHATSQQQKTSIGVTTIDNQSAAVNHLFIGRDMAQNNTSSITRNRSPAENKSPVVRRIVLPREDASFTENLSSSSTEHKSKQNQSATSNTASGDQTEHCLTLCADGQSESNELAETSKINEVPTPAGLTSSASMPALSENSLELQSQVKNAPAQADDTVCCEETSPGNKMTNSDGSDVKMHTDNKPVTQDEPSDLQKSALSHKSHSISDFKSVSVKLTAINADNQPALQMSGVAGAIAVKVFNPFPKQYVNKRRTHNGIRLGLYSANDVTSEGRGGICTGSARNS